MSIRRVRWTRLWLVMMAMLAATAAAASSPVAAVSVAVEPTPPAAGNETATATDAPGASTSDFSWVQPLVTLANAIIRLPFQTSASASSPSSGHQANELLMAFRSTPQGQIADYSQRLGRLLIPRWESRVFPDSLELMRSRPWFKDDMDAIAEAAWRGEGEGDGEQNDEVPRFLRASIVHVLAGRGFHEALATVLSFLPADQLKEVVNQPAALSATLSMPSFTPMHCLALYAPDTVGEGVDSILVADLLLKAGANFTADATAGEDGQNSGVAPMVIAGERGHVRLFSWLLSHTVPPSYLTRNDPLDLHAKHEDQSIEFQSQWSDWLHHLDIIMTRENQEQADGKVRMEEEWAEYMAWYDSLRPRTAQQLQYQQIEQALFQTFMMASVSNRVDVLRLILSGPGEGYGIKARINERSHEGRGDCVLHAAVIHGHQAIVETLLEFGADPSILSYDQKSLMQLAQQFKQFELHAWLGEKMQAIRPAAKSKRQPSQAQIHDPVELDLAAKPKAEKSKYEQAKEKNQKKKQKASKQPAGEKQPDPESSASSAMPAAPARDEL